ncbi:MAG: Crp/Fnr family transcriptional regulator [Clostridia bacterium]|nr:Crp/Fnr family transcriptional regulator [Clostridia bacterium]
MIKSVSDDTLLGEKMKKDAYDFTRLFLFSGMNREQAEAIVSENQPRILEYKKGECIFSPHEFYRMVGFVLSGECEVRRSSADSKNVIFNTLTQYDSFGVMAVFTEEESFPTEIYAKKNTAVLFFEKESIFSMIKAHPEISMNVIEFLSRKILFLNRKLDTFSQGTVERKLGAFLLYEYEKYGVEFPLNCLRCAEKISAGRASVYRAIDSLVGAGLITYDNKKIFIKDPEGLEEFSK